MIRRFASIFLSALCAVALSAAAPDTTVSEAEENEEAEVVKNLHHEISEPVVPQKQRAFVREHMQKVAEQLYREGFEVETMREGEAVIATIQTDYLFPQNGTELLSGAAPTLDKFIRYFSQPGMYKIVLAAHSDNTGSEEYLLDLTEARINAILDHFEHLGLNLDSVVGFPMADFDPMVENDTRKNRSLNRRVEFYIVPGQDLINLAKSSKKK